MQLINDLIHDRFKTADNKMCLPECFAVVQLFRTNLIVIAHLHFLLLFSLTEDKDNSGKMVKVGING